MTERAGISFTTACRRVILFAIFFAAAAAFATPDERWAQLTDVGFQNFTQETGLPSPIGTSLAEDGDGFVWIGTESGLARWDGYRFRTYKPVAGNSDSLPDGWIQTLHVDPRGALWVGTNGGGLARYDRDGDKFHSYGVGPDGLSHVFVRALEDDAQGGLWIGTEGGLDHLDADGTTITHLRHDDKDPATPPADRIVALLRSASGDLWLGTRAGLYRRSVEGGPFIAAPLPAPDGKEPFIRALHEDRDGRIWVGTMGNGVFLIDKDGKTAQAITASDPTQSTLESERVLAITQSLNGDIWVATYSAGIFIIDPASLRTRQVRRDVTLPGSLGSDTVWAFLRQRSGMMWVGTGRGVSRYDPAQAAIVSSFGASNRKEGIRDSNVTSALELPDGHIWLGLGAEGVDILDPLGHRVGALVSGSDHPETTLPKDFVWSITAGARDVWLGTTRGLYRAGFDGKRLERLALTRPDPAASVDAVKLDGDLLWMGSWGDGLWLLDIGGKDPKVLRHEPPDKLTDRRINAIEKGADGAIWIGTASGLNRMDPVSGEIERIPAAPADQQGLPGGSITSLLLDRAGRLWVASLGGGIALLEAPAAPGIRRFRHIGLQDGLPNANIDKVLQDRAGDLWVSTDDGIARIDGKTLEIKAFRREEGLQIAAYWGGAGIVTREDEIVFGGGAGLTVIRPGMIGQEDQVPPVVVTEARVGKSAVPASRFNGEGSREPLMVEPGANSLEVEFAALDYAAPERNRYSYRLDGYDKDWVEVDSNHRVAAYTNLAPGDYVLRLHGSNHDGVWSVKEVAVPVTVKPAWYQSWWCRLLEAAALLVAVYAIVHLRTAYLRRAKRELEGNVAERTKSLQEAMAALEETSLTDPLTGLRNRRFLTANIEQDILLHLRHHEDAKEKGEAAIESDMIFFLVDIDHFKLINDRHGHAGGDAILVQMKARLQRVFRDSDYIVRWGGEEFLAVARATSRDHAETLAERLRLSMADEEFTLDDGKPLSVTCSIGFGVLPFFSGQPRSVRWAEIVDMADICLYIVKRAGRNGWAGLIAGETVTDGAATIRQAKENLAPLVERGAIKVASNLDGEKVLGALPVPSSAA